MKCYSLFVWAGQSQPSMMPFSLTELVTLSRCLRDACLGIIKLAYPETKTEHKEEYVAAFRSVGVKTNSQVQQCIQAQQKRWVQLFKVNNSASTYKIFSLAKIMQNLLTVKSDYRYHITDIKKIFFHILHISGRGHYF